MVMTMSRKYIYTVLSLLVTLVALNAQEVNTVSNTVTDGNTPHQRSESIDTLVLSDTSLSPSMDVTKSLYGKIAGLNVYEGSGFASSGIGSLNIHGQAPIVLVDGFERSLEDLTTSEIESVAVLKDAVSIALFGIRGANGVVSITTKRGAIHPLRVSANYSSGLHFQNRSPRFSDAATYATHLNQALALDGLPKRYTDNEINAFRDGHLPYAYPNVNWWNESLNTLATTHNGTVSVRGGSERFRFYSVLNYIYDRGFLIQNKEDDRYNSSQTDTQLSLRANLDVNLTSSTFFKVGLMGKIAEINRARHGSIFNAIYNTPSAAFPIRHADGIWGGSSVYGANNPVALLCATGSHKTTIGTLLADLGFTQDFSQLVDGLSANLAISFDNSGSMFDANIKQYRYKELRPQLLSDRKTVVSDPVIYGKDSEVLGHSQDFSSLLMRAALRGGIQYHRVFDDLHEFSTSVSYSQQSMIRNNRNTSTKNQAIIGTINYGYDDRYLFSGVLSYSGTAFLSKKNRFHLYPALSATWNISNEAFMAEQRLLDHLALSASYGTAGWDGNLSHELYLQGYGRREGGGYFFTNNVDFKAGQGEGPLPAHNLMAEHQQMAQADLRAGLLGNRLYVKAEGFYTKRSHILVPPGTISRVIGIPVNVVDEGIQEYYGADLALKWHDTVGDLTYSLYVNGSYVDSKLINDNQEFQPHDYLYRKGNRVNQVYGLEVEGFFRDQAQINSSPTHTFSDVMPGDIRYKDQNNDGLINDLDVVKLSGTTSPRFYYGFGVRMDYRGIALDVDLQGLAGRTVNLLRSPLYKPLVDNGNISDSYLQSETPWTPDNQDRATMPRLTTKSSPNNYRNNSLWYRDGSFLKLRNVKLSYTIPESILSFTTAKVYVQGTDLLSIDKLKTVDPEHIAGGYPSSTALWLGIHMDF